MSARNLIIGSSLSGVFVLAALLSFLWVPQDVTQLGRSCIDFPMLQQ